MLSIVPLLCLPFSSLCCLQFSVIVRLLSPLDFLYPIFSSVGYFIYKTQKQDSEETEILERGSLAFSKTRAYLLHSDFCFLRHTQTHPTKSFLIWLQPLSTSMQITSPMTSCVQFWLSQGFLCRRKRQKRIT